jgi:hypothetical protein
MCLQKKNMAVHPLSTLPPLLVVADGTDIGTTIAFIGG